MKLGAKIRKLREAKGITKEKLAYENGLSKATITRIERDEFDPKLSTLKKIAKGLGVGLNELI